MRQEQSNKLRRYQTRTEQYVQNRMFQTNQVKLFERLEKENRSNDIRPGSHESVRFWEGYGTNQLHKIMRQRGWQRYDRQVEQQSKKISL